jgi:hypothetical protein
MKTYNSSWSIISWMIALSAFNFTNLSFHASSITSAMTFALPFPVRGHRRHIRQ